MSSEVKAPWIHTADNKRFSLTDPQPDQISIRTIAKALSQINRFTGHTRWPYSVAQHSVLVLRLFEDLHPFAMRSKKVAALFHDAAEAYCGDIASPLKSLLPEYKAIERRILVAI